MDTSSTDYVSPLATTANATLDQGNYEWSLNSVGQIYQLGTDASVGYINSTTDADIYYVPNSVGTAGTVAANNDRWIYVVYSNAAVVTDVPGFSNGQDVSTGFGLGAGDGPDDPYFQYLQQYTGNYTIDAYWIDNTQPTENWLLLLGQGQSGIKYAIAGSPIAALNAIQFEGSTVENVYGSTTPAPVITPHNQSVAQSQTVTLSSMFTVSSSTGVTEYQVWFGDAASPPRGTITNNGVPIATNQAVTVSSLTNLIYTGPATSGTDKIWLKAYNGTWDAAWAEADITDLGPPGPVITPHSQTVTDGETVPLSNIFSVSGTGITEYLVWFGDTAPGNPPLGTVTNNGTPIATNQSVLVSSLSGLTYTGSATTGTDKIWLEAYNGSYNSGGWILANLSDSGVPAPTITPHSQTVTANQTVPFSNLFSVAGSGTTEYQVWFGDAASPPLGTLTNNGTPIATNASVMLSGLSGLVYTGSATTGTDKIWLKAYDGNWNATWTEVDIADPGTPLPVITPHNQTVATGETVPFSNIFSVAGSGITEYQVWFGDAASPPLGTLANNSTPIAANQSVMVSSLTGLTYTGSATAGTDKIWLKAYNGSWDANWAEVDLADSGTPRPTITPHSQSVAYGQTVPFSNIFSVVGSGITQYLVWFGDTAAGAPPLGTLANNGTPIATNQAVPLTSLSGLGYAGSASSGTDKIWLEAYNGAWTNWVEADLADQGTAPPVITPHNQSTSYNQTIALSSLFAVSGLGITKYEVWFGDPGLGAPPLGTVTENGTPIATNTPVTVTSLSGLVYTGSTTAGTDKIWLEASNGSTDAAGWVEVDITGQGTLPQVFQRTGSELTYSYLTAWPTPEPTLQVFGFGAGAYKGDFGVVWSAVSNVNDQPNVNTPGAVFTTSGTYVGNISVNNSAPNVLAETSRGNLAEVQLGTIGSAPILTFSLDDDGSNSSGILVTGQTNHQFSDASVVAATDTIGIAYYDVFNGATSLKLELTSESNWLNSGTISGTSLTVAAPSGWTYNPSVSYPTHIVQESGGNFLIEWTGSSSNTTAEGLTLVNSSGTVLQTRELTSSALGMDMVAMTNGNVAMAVDYGGQVAFEMINGSSLATITKTNVSFAAGLPNADSPQIALLTNGDFAIAWHAYKGSTPVIDAQVVSSSGQLIGSVVNVSSESNVGDNLGVAALSNGGFVVSWVDVTSQSSSLVSQVFLPASGSSGISSKMAMSPASNVQAAEIPAVNPVTIASGATVELSSAYAGEATFVGSSGTLQLDNSSSFAGTVAGMTGQDSLDLRDISLATAKISYSGDSSGGTLSITAGAHVANIALLGNYLASTFATAGDGHSGTSITVQPAPFAQLAPTQHA